MDGDAITIIRTEAGQVVGVEQDDVAAVDAAVDIFIFIDDGVELAFAAERHEANLAVGGALQIGQLVRVDAGAAVGSGKLRLVEGTAADLEFLFRAVNLGEIVRQLRARPTE